MGLMQPFQGCSFVRMPLAQGSFLFFLDLLTDHELDRRELMGRREQCGRVVLWCLVPGG